MNDSDLIDAIVDIARDAGREILEVYVREFSVQEKQDNSPLTEADQRAHDLIARRLATLPLTIPVMSEEDVDGFLGPDALGRYWLVDPLDGTKEFIKRNGEFTVNIALIDAGRSVLGVVQAPVSGELAWAWSGGGAWIAQGQAQARACRTRARGNPLRVAGSRSHGNPRMDSMLQALGPYELTPLGSSLKFLRIAGGEADLYVRLGPTSEWDTAAAQCVLEQAGGAVLDFQGQPLRYNGKESLLNPEFIACGDPRHDWAKLLSP